MSSPAQSEISSEAPLMVFDIGPILHKITDEVFENLCTQNPHLRIQMNNDGKMLIWLSASSDSDQSDEITD